MKERKKGRVAWNKGKTGIYTKEQLIRISNGAKGRIPWNKGKQLSEETKRKIGDANRGRKLSEENLLIMAKRNSGKGNPFYGKKHTEETKKKLSELNKGRKIKPFSDEHKRKIGDANRGRVYSEEYLKSIRGENSQCWKGGKSFETYPQEWTDDLKESIRKRDGYVCQLCGLHQDEMNGFIKKLHVHHIDYNKDNCDPKNLVTLCVSCHVKTNYNREQWLKHFFES